MTLWLLSRGAGGVMAIVIFDGPHGGRINRFGLVLSLFGNVSSGRCRFNVVDFSVDWILVFDSREMNDSMDD